MFNKDIHLKPQAQSITPANFLTIPQNSFLRANIIALLNNSSFTLSGTIIRPDNSTQLFTFDSGTITTETLITKDIIVPEGILLGLSIKETSNGNIQNTLTIMLELRKGTQLNSTAIATIGTFKPNKFSPDGYPTPAQNNTPSNNIFISKPTFPNGFFVDGNNLPVSNFARYKLILGTIIVITDATIGNRTLQLQENANGIIIAQSAFTQTASQTITYVYAPYQVTPTDLATTKYINVPPLHWDANSTFSLKLLGDSGNDTFTTLLTWVKVYPYK